MLEDELSEQIQAVRGMNDVLPAEIGAWQRIESAARDLLGRDDTDLLEVIGVDDPAEVARLIAEANAASDEDDDDDDDDDEDEDDADEDWDEDDDDEADGSAR